MPSSRDTDATPHIEQLSPAFVLDRTVRRLEDGRLLLGGEPPRLVRLRERAATQLDRLLEIGNRRHGDTTPVVADAAMEALLRRLVDNAIVHPLPAADATRLDEVSVVVPVRDDAERLARLLGSLFSDGRRRDAGASHGRRRGPRVIVVDDGSAPVAARSIACVAEAAGAHLVRHRVALGPGNARNSGLAMVATPLVAFVDADVLPEQPLDACDSWLAFLVGHFDDATVAAVSPRIVAREPPGGVARGLLAYECLHSPLDLGPTPASVGQGRRVRYVPGAAFVARASVLRELGGFDPDLRYGEDVDIVWRMVRAGWKVRYAPSARVGHDVRRTWLGVARQRFAYGTAAGALARRHEGAVAAYECSPRGLVLAGAVICASLCRRPSRAGAGMWAVATLTFLAPSVQLARKLRHAGVSHGGTLAAKLILRANRGELAGLRQSMRRAWWPFTVVLLAALRRNRRLLAEVLAFLMLPSAIEATRRSRRPDCSPMAWVGLCLLDDLSYGLGVWVGAARHGRAGPLLLKVKRRSPRRPTVAGRPEPM